MLESPLMGFCEINSDTTNCVLSDVEVVVLEKEPGDVCLYVVGSRYRAAATRAAIHSNCQSTHVLEPAESAPLRGSARQYESVVSK